MHPEKKSLLASGGRQGADGDADAGADAVVVVEMECAGAAATASATDSSKGAGEGADDPGAPPRRKKELATPWLAQLSDAVTQPVGHTWDTLWANQDAVVEALLLYLLPAAYVPLFVFCVSSVDDALSTWYLPLLGVAAGVVSNSLPVGPAVIFLPLLVKLVEHDSVHLSVEFTQATWAVGSGVVGALQWMRYERQQQGSHSWHGSNGGCGSGGSDRLRVLPRLIIWESLSYTVVPCWVGTVVGLLAEPELPNGTVGTYFGLFCIVLAAYLYFRVAQRVRARRQVREAAYARGLMGVEEGSAMARRAVPPTAWDLLPDSLDVVGSVVSTATGHASACCRAVLRLAVTLQVRMTGMSWFPATATPGTTEGGMGMAAYRAASSTQAAETLDASAEADAEAAVAAVLQAEGEAGPALRLLDSSTDPTISVLVWYRLVFVSFMGGLVLLPNIGAGPSLLTYACLLMLGYTSVQAMVTAVVTGGLCCWCPFFVHAVVLKDVPAHVWPMWAMALPGMAVGAWAAPRVSETVGPEVLEATTCFFLLLTSLLFL